MKKKDQFLKIILACGLLFGPVVQAELEKSAGNEVKFATEGESAFRKADIEGLYQSILADIKAQSTGKSVADMLKDPKLMHLVAAEEIIRITGIPEISKLMQKDRKYAQFLNVFLRNTDWMERYLRAGIVPPNTQEGLRVFADIWAAEGKSQIDFQNYIELAISLASTWGNPQKGETFQRGEKYDTVLGKFDPVWRYNFFKNSHKDNKLHDNFANLKAWELRFVAGVHVDDASLKYAQENINVPPSQMGDACWAAEYRGVSEFGHSVQSPLFYVGWGNDMGGSTMTAKHGGVCGALSTLGMGTSAAHGIPAFTMGQPGHCAYGFRLKRGEWLGGFGGPDGGAHITLFGERAPTCYRLMEAVFMDDKKTEEAYKAMSLAEALVALKDDKNARDAWREAIRISPLNYHFHKAFQKWAKENNVYTKDQWKEYALGVLSIHKGHGYAAYDVLQEVEPLFLEGTKDDEKLAWYTLVNEAIAETPGSWALDLIPIIEAQDSKLDNIASREDFLASILSTHLNHGDGTNFGKALEWSIKRFVEGNQTKIFAGAFAKAASGNSASAEKLDEKAEIERQNKMRSAYGKAIVAAEMARSPVAFEALTKASEAYRNPDDPNLKEEDLQCPEGIMVSDRGMLRLSTSSNWDRPCDHAGVLTKKGGFFHTDSEEAPHVIVELKEGVNLTGLLVVKASGGQERMKKMKVSRSVDGATWFEVASTDNMERQWKIETPDNPAARWIKVESLPGEKNFMHLRNVLIFAQ